MGRRQLLVVAVGGLLLGGVLLLKSYFQHADPKGGKQASASSTDEPYQDELLAAVFLDDEEKEPGPVSSPTGKETSTAINIAGQQGQLWKGWYANGQQWYEHTWLNDKQHGKHLDWDDRGRKVAETHWQDGCLHGRFTRWYGSGQIAEDANYDHYRLHGSRRSWFRNGQEKLRVEYQEGQRNGLFLAWHKNGQKLCEASFVKDRLHGTWRKWDEHGQLVREVTYQHGVVLAEKSADAVEPVVYPGDLGAGDLAFVLGQGSGWHGYHTFKVTASGKCEYRYFTTERRVNLDREGKLGGVLKPGQVYLQPVWRKAEFQLTAGMQRRLRDALKAADLFSLKAAYINEQIADGTQWMVLLRAARREKRIYCSNQFPARLRELSRTIREDIMLPHRLELWTASMTDKGRVEPDDNWPASPAK